MEGVAGVVEKAGKAVEKLSAVLCSIQHRGKVGWGLVFLSKSGMRAILEDGFLFSRRGICEFEARASVGHVREWDVRQPIISKIGRYAYAFSGIAKKMRNQIEEVAEMGEDLLDALEESPAFEEEYFSGVVLGEGGELYALRSAYGLKPLIMGRIEEGFVVASESVGVDVLRGEVVGDVAPGEVIKLSPEGLERKRVAPSRSGCCAFELMHFARPDSVIDGHSVHRLREELGRKLAERDWVKGDVVVPVPESGRSYALGYSLESGIPLREAIVRNPYVWGRIARKDATRIGLRAIRSAVRGKSVVLVDNFIFSGNTVKSVALKLREAGAKEIHLRLAAPPIRRDCPFTPKRKKLKKLSPESLGVNSVLYLEEDDLRERLPRRTCMDCLSRKPQMILAGREGG